MGKSFDSRFKVLYFVIYFFKLKFLKRWNVFKLSSYIYCFVNAKNFNAISRVTNVGRSFAVSTPKKLAPIDPNSLNVGFSQFIRSKPKRSAETFEVTRPLPIWLGKRRRARCGQTAAVAAEPVGARRRSIWPWKCHPWITRLRTRTITRRPSTDPDTGTPTRVSAGRKHTGSMKQRGRFSRAIVGLSLLLLPRCFHSSSIVFFLTREGKN